jgi:hypothetical protein
VQISPEVEVRHDIECVLGLVDLGNLKRVRRALLLNYAIRLLTPSL